MIDNLPHPDPPSWWKHRRRMAYGGLIFCVVAWAVGLTLGILFPAQSETTIVPITSMAFWGGLIPMATYMGNNAIENVAKIRGAGNK